MLIKKKPTVKHARTGMAMGMKIHRCAFALMIKFSGNIGKLQEAVDEVDFTLLDLEDTDFNKTQKNKKLLEAL